MVLLIILPNKRSLFKKNVETVEQLVRGMSPHLHIFFVLAHPHRYRKIEAKGAMAGQLLLKTTFREQNVVF